MSEEREQAKTLKTLIDQCERIVIFTGAGISTESGVSDYRSKGGLWQKFQPVTLQEFLNDPESRREYWRRKKEMYSQIRNAKPNAGHSAVAEIEKKAKWAGVITQNIDGFHQLAGTQRILEIHGTNREAICWDCKKIFPFEGIHDRLLAGEEIPLCKECNGILKPNTISFGQNLDPEVLNQSFDWSKSCNLMIAIGSTLVVEPAASMPRLAKESGAYLIIINREETPLDHSADMVVHTSIGDFLNQVIKQ